MKLNHFYKFLYLTILIFVFFTFKIFAVENIDERVKKLTLELRCMTCQNQSIYDSDAEFSNDIKKIVKNKLAPPFKTVEFDIMYGEGISKTGEILDMASKKGIIEKSGAWYSYKNDRIGQGRENAKIFLKENSNISEEIENSLRKSISLPESDLNQETDETE